MLCLHVLTAVVGTVLIGGELYRTFRSGSFAQGLWLETFLCVALAFLFGYLVFQLRRTVLAKWIWVPGVVWFAYYLIAVYREGWALWPQFSGAGCIEHRQYGYCYAWFEATTPTLRLIFYSLGAYVCSLRIPTASPVPVPLEPAVELSDRSSQAVVPAPADSLDRGTN